MKQGASSPAGTDEVACEYDAVAEAVRTRLAKNARVRRNLPGGGRLRIDRQLPFLCIYRQPPDDADRGTRELVTTEAAYLFASGDPNHQAGLVRLCSAVSSAMLEHFGRYLLIEIWADREAVGAGDGPRFEVVAAGPTTPPATAATLQDALEGMTVGGKRASVAVRPGATHPPSMASLVGARVSDDPTDQAATLGLCVAPIYRDAQSGVVYPLVLQSFRWKLATALRKTIAEFIGVEDKQNATHYHAWGPSSLVKAARIVDQQLGEVSESYDYLLQVTPTNTEEARQGFRESGYRQLPPLRYRHLPYHPNLLKRQLFEIEIERVEDPCLAHLFWEKQDEIDRQLTSLRDLHLPETTAASPPEESKFLSSSLQLYGGAETSLVELAEQILAFERPDADRPRRRGRQGNRWATVEEVVRQAREEIDHYHCQMSEFNATVELSDSIAAGIMVSRDKLLIASDLTLARRRVKPLLHHEVGTHLLTYFNGRCQPFRQLYAGLAGYEALQEGLAVLAEYLVGGLTLHRLRTLAARVMAVAALVEGTPFAETYHQLHQQHGLSRRRAFTTAVRAYRGGGLTKDVIYLRGLRDLLDYVAEGHDIEPLYVGKIGLQHVPYVQELRRREIIVAPRLLPRFWDDAATRERLENLRGKTVLDLTVHAKEQRI